MLEAVGLSQFDEAVLRQLLDARQHTVTTLADRLGAPADTVRKTVRRLAEFGLVGRDGTAIVPVDPRVALTGQLRDRRTELDRLTATVDELSAAFHDRALSGSATRLVEVIEGRTAINARFQDMVARADEEMLAFDTPPYVVTNYGDSEGEAALLARQVTCRAIYSAEVLDHPVRAERIRAMVGLGEHARVIPHLPIKLVIADRREAMLPLSRASEEEQQTRAAVIHRSGLCDALVALFEAVWAQAVPMFTARTTTEDPDLDSQDHAILQCLAAGMTDDVIGRQLGISERTVRRRVADLSTRVGASTRFQVGAQAARRGWI